MGSSSVNLIIPVHGAEGPAVKKKKKSKVLILISKTDWLCSSVLILCSLVFIHISFTSKAGTVWWIHGNYRVRGPGRTAHTRIVEGSNPKGIGAALNKPSDRKTGILHWSVITLGPMMSAHLQPVKKYLDDKHWCELYGLTADGIWLTCQWRSQWWNCCPPLLAASR